MSGLEQRNGRVRAHGGRGFGPAVDAAAKIVGVSADSDSRRVRTRCEERAWRQGFRRPFAALLSGHHPSSANKGTALTEFAKLMASVG